jgi:nucleolin
MSKSKAVKPQKASDPLTKVKAAGVEKPGNSVKAKAKEAAKAVGKKPELVKKIKEKTPESSSEEESESEASESESESESESDEEVVNGKNGVKKAADSDSSSDDSEESDSDDEPANGVNVDGATEGTIPIHTTANHTNVYFSPFSLCRHGCRVEERSCRQ